MAERAVRVDTDREREQKVHLRAWKVKKRSQNCTHIPYNMATPIQSHTHLLVILMSLLIESGTK
jgi:hypothetical protein